MTVTHGNVQNGSVYIKDGKIAAVGKDVNAPSTATVIDAGGKYLTPGIIDSHSHIALDDDVNEATSPITPQMMMIDAFDYQDKAIYRGLAGGVTTSLLLARVGQHDRRAGGGDQTQVRRQPGRDAVSRCAAVDQVCQRRKSQAGLRRQGPTALDPHGKFRGAARGPGGSAGLHARVG